MMHQKRPWHLFDLRKLGEEVAGERRRADQRDVRRGVEVENHVSLRVAKNFASQICQISWPVIRLYRHRSSPRRVQQQQN